MPETRSGWFLSTIHGQRLAVPLLAGLVLVFVLALALDAARSDSLTVDEPSHLLAGHVARTTGDFRLSPDHPPLARMFLALPLAGSPAIYDPADAASVEGWRSGDFFKLGREWVAARTDGQQYFHASRFLAILLLALLVVTVGLVAGSRFGAAGGLIALWVVAFDPALLAHGHLATMDVPFALIVLWVLVAADRALARPLARPRPGRLALLALLFAAATLIKFSFFALIPALVAMAVASWGQEGWREILRRLVLGALLLGSVAFVAIWAAYGFRFAAARGEDAATATMHVLGDNGQPRPTTPAGAWEVILHDPATRRDRPGLAAPLLRFARTYHLLPEAYLYGAAYVAKKGLTRASYFRGEHSMEGFALYFPWAFAIKTPLPALVLFGLGLWAGWQRLRQRPAAWLAKPSPLAWGGLVFAGVYLAALGSSALNLGVRHLLPITPLLAIAVGGFWPQGTDAATPGGRWRRVGVGLLLLWLTGTTVAAAPHFLGYFNELVGGWRNGHLHLADSNLDWGQDLLRLEERLRADKLRADKHSGPIWLAQAGFPPLPPGLTALGTRQLFGEGRTSPHPAPIGGGLFVISASELVGVYRPLARVEAWRDPRLIDQYERLAAERQREGRLGPSPDGLELDAFEMLRRLRLVSRLAQREPAERIGTSLFLYRLSDEQVREVTAP